MKKVRVIDIIAIVIAVLCIIAIGLSFVLPLNTYVIYGASFLLGASIIIVIYIHYIDKLKNKIDWQAQRIKLGNSISYRVKVAGEKSFNEMPLGIVIYNSGDYHIEWANPYAKNIFQSQLIERHFENFDDRLGKLIRTEDNFNIDIYGKEYSVEIIRSDNIVFFTDKTDFKELEKKYENRTQAAGIINLDNYDQALSGMDAQRANEVNGDIIGIIKTWSAKYGIYNRGYSDKQYLIIMDREQLERVKIDEFDIIDEINEYCNKENLRITVSIGISCLDKGIIEIMTKAEEMLNMAFNRGGNQAVLFMDGRSTYYGGKVAGVNIYEPVGVRLRFEELRDEILNSDKVIVMAHKDTDADAFASSLAFVKLARAYKKESYMVFSEKSADDTVKAVYNDICLEHINLTDLFITPSKAISLITKDTLLILSDVQYADLLIDSRVLDKVRNKTKKVAIIDHHRSTDRAIKEHCYFYNNTASSSSVEIIMEMLDFVDENVEVEISNYEAIVMLLGILVDTTNLMYRTSEQTFIVIAKLQRLGADMSYAQKYLREKFENYSRKVQILSNVDRYRNKYGIAIYDGIEPVQRQFLAKIADSLIQVDTFMAGFCIGRIPNDEIGISARSLGEENVQVIMEILGGGGHFNNAAVQLKETTIEETVKELKSILDDIDEGKDKEIVKVILTQDVKGKGKRNDIIEINNGYANHLIRTNAAVIASPDNINELKRQNEIDKKQAAEYLEKMKALKEEIEKDSITIKVQVGREGKMFGGVSTKIIIDELKNQKNVEYDKKKMQMDLKEKEIDKLGTYEINIKLHKEVTAKLTIKVVEK